MTEINQEYRKMNSLLHASNFELNKATTYDQYKKNSFSNLYDDDVSSKCDESELPLLGMCIVQRYSDGQYTTYDFPNKRSGFIISVCLRSNVRFRPHRVRHRKSMSHAQMLTHKLIRFIIRTCTRAVRL